MARRVFFSFHYKRDVRRIQQIRSSWVIRPGGEAQPFYDKAEFEKVKARAGGIAKWIDEQLAGTSVTVVLYGAETYTRPWVLYEIRRSIALGKGLLAIDIHSVKDPSTGTDAAGINPLSQVKVSRPSGEVAASLVYPSYDWVREDGYNNMPAWIEAAAKAAGR